MKKIGVITTLALLLTANQSHSKSVISIDQLKTPMELLKKDLDRVVQETSALSGAKLTQEREKARSQATDLNAKFFGLAMGLGSVMGDKPTNDKQVLALGAITDILSFTLKRASTASKEFISSNDVTPFDKAKPAFEVMNKYIAGVPTTYATKSVKEVLSELSKSNVQLDVMNGVSNIALPLDTFASKNQPGDRDKTVIVLIKSLDLILTNVKNWLLL